MDFGKVTINPSNIVAGSFNTVTINYTPASQGTARGGGLRIYSYIKDYSWWTFIRWKFGKAFCRSEEDVDFAKIVKIPWGQEAIQTTLFLDLVKGVFTSF